MHDLASPWHFHLFLRSSLQLSLFLYVPLLYIILLYCCPAPENLVRLPVLGGLAGAAAPGLSAGSLLSDLTLHGVHGGLVKLL